MVIRVLASIIALFIVTMVILNAVLTLRNPVKALSKLDIVIRTMDAEVTLR